MKRKLYVICLIVFFSFFVFSCKRNCEKEGHLWVTTNRIDSTCITNGSEEHECTSCGVTETIELPLEEHSWVVKEEKPATCIEEGCSISICSVCGEEKTAILPLINHSYELMEHVDPTCSSGGYNKYRCTVCHAEYEEKIALEPSAHVFTQEVLTPATCISDGKIRQACNICGYSEILIQPALGHEFYKFKCSRCGEIQEIPTQYYDECKVYFIDEKDEWGELTGNRNLLMVTTDANYTDQNGDKHDAEVEILINIASDYIQFAFFTPEGEAINVLSPNSFKCRTENGLVERFSVGQSYRNTVEIDNYLINSMNNLIVALLQYDEIMFLLDTDNNDLAFTINYDHIVISRMLEECGSDYCCTIDGRAVTISNDSSIEDVMLRWCSLLTNIELPDGVETISNDMFGQCSSLTSIDIPDSVKTIGERAFFDCDSLMTINIPDSVTTIGEDAFWDCDSLMTINIPDSVTTIGDGVFRWCNRLTTINIADGVETIGNGVFIDCSSLTNINIPDSVTTIGAYAFSGCTSLTSIDIPDSVTTIGDGAFSDCDNLTSINLPDSVTTIGIEAFKDCSSLTSIDIPDSVTKIGEEAFYGCTSLMRVEIPRDTNLGRNAFNDNTRVIRR